MEFKGRWELFKPDHIGCENVSIGTYTGFNPFIEVWHHQFDNINEAKNTALLISKAPEMLEMLMEVLENKSDVDYEKIKQLIKELTLKK
jgi:hypothetical protein